MLLETKTEAHNRKGVASKQASRYSYMPLLAVVHDLIP